MATAVQPLTLEEFHTRFDGEKPYYEYWFGEAIQKSMPTWLHSVLQRLITDLLIQAGYRAGQEIELRIDSSWQPVPDVLASSERISQPYPTKPVDVVVEILSPTDEMGRTLDKCIQYKKLGIPRVWVLDPERQQGWEWNSERSSLDRTDILSLPNCRTIPLAEVWPEMLRRADL